MFSVKSTRLLLLAIVLAMTLGLAMCSTTTPAVTTTSPPKMTRQQKVASVTHSDKDIAFNTIPGASDQYVPEQHSSNRSTSTSQLLNFEANSNTSSVLANTTNSQANVFEATAQANLSHPDPLQVNAQQQNPFLSNVPGGINPQIAMMLQNNPRLQMLARQNPIVAQQIMRNPQLLRDPQIQRAIQSQMGPGQGQSLLGRLGQSGLLNNLGRALNPLGLPIGINPAALNRQQQQQQLNNNQMNRGTGGLNRLGGSNNQVGNNFGLPRSQQPVVNPHRETLPGGYYGNNGGNGNYNNNNHNNNPNLNGHANLNENANPAVENTGDEGAGEEGVADPGAGEGAGENVSPDYDGAGGAGEGAGGEEENPGAGADDSQQNPAEDPDIQQLQNFGGPVSDNFPEGLFPPGLLTQDDINEIRKQQEKQAKEAEEKERQQQQQQQAAQGGQGGADYEDNGGDDSNGAGEEVPTEGAEVAEGAGGEGGEGAAEGANAGEHGAAEDAGVAGAAGTDGSHANDGQNSAVGAVSPVQGNSFHNPNPGYGNSNAYAPVSNQMQSPPAAYQNSYQPIQPPMMPPVVQRGPLQPSIEYANNGYPANNGMLNHQPMGQLNQLNNNQLGGYQSGVQYDDPNQLYNQQQHQQQQQQQYNPFQLTTTPSPISQQYGGPPSNPLLQHFNGPPHPSQFNRGYNRQQTPQQSPRPWQTPSQPFNGGLNFDPRRLQGNPRNSMANFGGANGNTIHSDDPYRSNVFNQQRPAFQQRPRGYMD